MTQQDIFTLAIYAGSAFLIGFIARKWIVPILIKWANRTRWKYDDIFFESIKDWLIFWFFLGGIALALVEVNPPANYEKIIQKTIIIMVVISVTWVIAKFTSRFIAHKTHTKDGVVPSTSIITNIVRIIIYVVGLLFLLQALGVSITPLLTALGVGGLAVALALQQTLTNLFAGIQIIASGKLNPGNYVQLTSGEEGYIEDITWRSTTIRALPNHIIIVPNSQMASSIIRNYTLPDHQIAVSINVGVSYSSDLEKVERVTIEVGKETMKEVQGGVADFDPFIRYNTFNDSSIDFTVILRAKEFVDQYLIKHEFIKRLQKRYQQENIEIPFPIRTVYLHQDEK